MRVACALLAERNMIAIMSSLIACLAELPSESIDLEAGAILFRRDAEIRALFVVENGLVHLMRYRVDGAPSVMQRAQGGAVVAEASLFSIRYHCDAVAIRPTLARRFPIADVRGALAADAGFARAYAEHLAHEVHRMRLRSEILGMRRLSARLDAWLLLNPLPPRGEWSALADEIGVTREALYRELGRRRAGRGDAR